VTLGGTSGIRAASMPKESYKIPYGRALSQLIPTWDRLKTKSVIYDGSDKWMSNTHDKSYWQPVLQYRLVRKSHTILGHIKTADFSCNIPVAYPGFFFRGGGSTNLVEDRGQRKRGDLGALAP
jgi:hypothetical protein